MATPVELGMRSARREQSPSYFFVTRVLEPLSGLSAHAEAASATAHTHSGEIMSHQRKRVCMVNKFRPRKLVLLRKTPIFKKRRTRNLFRSI
jgi:hypothetical protein